MENTKQSQYEADDYMKNIIINTEPELITFLLDILEYGENIESEEILLEDTSYKILYLLLKNILPSSLALILLPFAGKPTDIRTVSSPFFALI